MRKLLRQTLAECLDGPMDRTYYVDKNNYHFEIASKGENLSFNIYNDFGFGGSHFYVLLQKNAVFEKKRRIFTGLFAERVLKLIESIPEEKPLDREKLYSKYKAKMEKEYRNLLSLAHNVQDIGELYDLLKDEKGEDTYVLINPKNDGIKASILRAQDLSYYLNRVHLDTLGIEVTEEEEEDYGFYEQNHKKDFLFEEVCGACYCKALDTEEHPIPWLLHMSFTGERKNLWHDTFESRYTEMLNYLAVKENRKIFLNLTQEAINEYKNENKPIIFHETTDDYWEEIHGDYYLWHEFHFRVDEKWDYEETMETLRKTLIEHNLL